MGAYFSKIGSDPYYANYEKSFQRLRKDIDHLSVSYAVHCLLNAETGNKITPPLCL